MELTSQDLVEMYRLMLLDRRFNEHVLRWYKEGRISQGIHPNVGQEAVGVGACYGLRPQSGRQPQSGQHPQSGRRPQGGRHPQSGRHSQDWVIPSLRTSSAFWVRGVTLLQQINAMFGNAESISRGKETAHHATYTAHGILPGTAIVGGSIPVAVGAALALRMQRLSRGTDNVVLDFFGDGASNRGDFHEALNMAALYKAPVVFICENNLYGQMVAARFAMAIRDIADRAVGYGMPGRIVDGQDVLAVYEATQEAVARARRGDGPTLLECKTYRFLPHYPIFKENRPPEEIAEWLKRDPLTIHGARLKEGGLLDDAAIEDMDKAILQELDDAIRQAEATPPPDPREVFQAVYADLAQGTGAAAAKEMGL